LFKIKVFYITIYINNSTFLKFFTKLIILIFSVMKRLNLINLVLATLFLFSPTNALADIGGLTKCSDSPAFTKRLNASVKKLQQRMTKYEADSPPALALKQQIERTEARFDKYGRSELLCGTDGLPHLVADGRWSHAAEFILPGFGFIYISGWIGWVGRKYVRAVSTTKNPAESEIIINVPLALKIMTTGYIWPISAWQELISGELIVPKDEITVSPR
jgi:photosystem I subunit III